MAFKLYDRDKDGYITKAEMVKLSKNLTKDQVEKVDIDREKCRVIIQYEFFYQVAFPFVSKMTSMIMNF